MSVAVVLLPYICPVMISGLMDSGCPFQMLLRGVDSSDCMRYSESTSVTMRVGPPVPVSD